MVRSIFVVHDHKTAGDLARAMMQAFNPEAVSRSAESIGKTYWSGVLVHWSRKAAVPGVLSEFAAKAGSC